MHFRKAFCLSILCTVGTLCFAQGNYTKPRNNNAKYRGGNGAGVLCPIFIENDYPYQGIGIKVGDPFALTYKFYPNKNFSFVVDAGRPASTLYNRYYREKFFDYVNVDTFSTSDAAINLITHKVKADFVAELKFLYHINAGKIAQGLQLYVGAGWQWKNTRLQYDYSYSSAPINGIRVGRFERIRTTAGPQAVVGIEYAYFQMPISAFMELEYFSDVQADLGASRVEGGLGLRYVF